jgi:hypothetical protein
VNTGFWYEWSLAIAPAFGVDFANRSATLFDEENVKISTSTWPQVGRAVANLLSLPRTAEGSCLEKFKDQVIYIDSFAVSQRDMLDSIYRVTGTTEADWKITKESAKGRYEGGVEAMQMGDHVEFCKMLYTRIFYTDGSGEFSGKGTLNSVLGLPKDDLDEATKRAIGRSESTTWP